MLLPRRPRFTHLRSVLFTGLMLVMVASATAISQAGEPRSAAVPGTRPDGAHAQPSLAGNGGLHTMVNERGRISRSIAGITSTTSDGGTLTAHKPAGATVRRAYLAYATTGFTNYRVTTPLTIDGKPVPVDNELANGIGSYNYFAEITGLVKPKLDAAATGAVPFTVVEPDPADLDGEILVVVFDDPAVTADQTVTILYGALSPTGDSYEIRLDEPIDTSKPGTHLDMSLGISYSHQDGGVQQFSTVTVNGDLMTSSAGGEDDGAPVNGSLLTVGGDGDSLSNPDDPQAPPTDARSDDELYNLLPFVMDGTSEVHVQTDNPSNDDNVFLATFTANPPVDVVTTSGDDTDGDGIPDDWELNGIHASDGEFINLPAMGANPLHKDIFLRVDAETGAQLSAGAKKIITASFQKAPVMNPDGTTGINLHITTGPTISAATSDGLKVFKKGKLDTLNFPKLFARWAADQPAQLAVFHYAVSVHWPDWGQVIGESANIPAQMVVVNQCGKRGPKTCSGNDTLQGSNLMHELGHNLGLHHGGDDDANGKPNYLSIMNYLFSNDGIPGIGVTYSHWGYHTFYNLDERSISETDGVLVKNPKDLPKGAKTRYQCGGKTMTIALSGPIDWNCDKKIQSGRVAADVNSDGFKWRLGPHNDWPNLIFDGGDIGQNSIVLPPIVPTF